MTIDANSPEEYLEKIPVDRKIPMSKLRQVILDNIPAGFQETMSYGMIGYVVPHSIYPDGYHCNPKLPLPFLNIASQKNFISVYHSALYADSEILAWFQEEYPKHTPHKLDMGKCCVRFKKVDQIPFELIGLLVKKMTVEDWITLYEKNIFKK